MREVSFFPGPLSERERGPCGLGGRSSGWGDAARSSCWLGLERRRESAHSPRPLRSPPGGRGCQALRVLGHTRRDRVLLEC